MNANSADEAYRVAHVASPLVFTAVDGTVTAYARTSGEVAWEFRVPDGRVDFRIGTRLCADDRYVVVVAARMNETGFFAAAAAIAHVCCLEYATGRLLWQQGVKASQNIGQFTATLLLDGAEVFLAHSDVLVAFTLETGQLLWQQRVGRVDERHPALAVSVAVAGQSAQADAR